MFLGEVPGNALGATCPVLGKASGIFLGRVPGDSTGREGILGPICRQSQDDTRSNLAFILGLAHGVSMDVQENLTVGLQGVNNLKHIFIAELACVTLLDVVVRSVNQAPPTVTEFSLLFGHKSEPSQSGRQSIRKGDSASFQRLTSW